MVTASEQAAIKGISVGVFFYVGWVFYREQMEQDEKVEGAKLQLSAGVEKRFRELRQADQEQVVFDAWRRVLQDWRHTRFEDWEEIDGATLSKRSVELSAWDDIGMGDHATSHDQLILVYTSPLSEVDDSLLADLFDDVSEHAERILTDRFDADE